MYKTYKVPEYFLSSVIAPSCENDERIIDAFRQVPREFFVDEAMRSRAYEDGALPIGHGQTISQPSLVAMMLHNLELTNLDKCLEVGAGSGFVAALLGVIADEVVAVEIISEHAKSAQEKLRSLRIRNASIFTSDGSVGYKRKAPYDKIIVSAGANSMPEALLEQLNPGGIMVIPVRGTLKKIIKKDDGTIDSQNLARVAFVEFKNT